MLRYGAQAGMRDGANESVIDIIHKHPEHRQDDFMKLIKKYRGQKPQVARVKHFLNYYLNIVCCNYRLTWKNHKVLMMTLLILHVKYFFVSVSFSVFYSYPFAFEEPCTMVKK